MKWYDFRLYFINCALTRSPVSSAQAGHAPLYSNTLPGSIKQNHCALRVSCRVLWKSNWPSKFRSHEEQNLVVGIHKLVYPIIRSSCVSNWTEQASQPKRAYRDRPVYGVRILQRTNRALDSASNWRRRLMRIRQSATKKVMRLWCGCRYVVWWDLVLIIVIICVTRVFPTSRQLLPAV